MVNSSIALVAVTKNRSLVEMKEVIAAGITDIGENRLKEAQGKLPNLPQNIKKHFIGQLQTNKVRDIVKLFDVIQSVDRLKLARKIDEECEKIGKIMTILIQVNTSDEPQKGGVAPDEAIALVGEVSELKNIQIQGLMTMAVYSDDKEKVRACFRKLKQLFDEIKAKNLPNVKMETLSMGMSEDYQIAIEEGSTMVRIGRRLFV